MDLKSMFQNRVSMWARYSKYEIKKNDEGNLFICPSFGATLQLYDPVDCVEEMIADILNLGCMLNDTPDNATIEKVVLKFTKGYGLLGWITALPMDADFYKEDNTYLGRNGALLGQKTMPTLAFINTFFPFQTGIQSTDLAASIGRDEIFNSVFSPQYTEPVLWMAGFLLQLYEHFYSVIHCNDEDLSSDERVVLQHYVRQFDNCGISFHLTNGIYPEMKWEFDSLNTVLETAYSLYITEEVPPLKMCKHCGKAFYNTNERSEFCSGKCRNQWNVYKSRNKKKNSEAIK